MGTFYSQSRWMLLMLAAYLAVTASGCQLLGNSASSSSTNTASSSTTTTTTGSGGTFTGSQLNGTWTSSCLSLTGVDGETYYKNVITLSGGNTLDMTQDTYTAASCLTAFAIAHWHVAGTFTVGGIVSGTTQSIQFNLTSATLMPWNAGAATWFSANSSNYTASGAMTAGVTYNFFYTNASVNGLFTPAPSVTYDTINNVATYSNSVLTLGAGAETIPGVFNNQTTPTSATVAYSYSP